MNWFLGAILAVTCTVAVAQQPPLYPPPPNRQGTPYDLRDQSPNHPQWDERERRRQWRHHQRYCREWRERVERHPRLILPRECWRR